MDISSLVELAVAGPQIRAGDPARSDDAMAGRFSLEDRAEGTPSDGTDVALADGVAPLGTLLPLCLLPVSKAPEAPDADMSPRGIASAPSGPDGRHVPKEKGPSVAGEVRNLPDIPPASVVEGDPRQPAAQATAAAGAAPADQRLTGTSLPGIDLAGALPDDAQARPPESATDNPQAAVTPAPQGHDSRRADDPAGAVRLAAEDARDRPSDLGGRNGHQRNDQNPADTGEIVRPDPEAPHKQTTASQVTRDGADRRSERDGAAPGPAERPATVAVAGEDQGAPPGDATAPSATAAIRGPSGRPVETAHQPRVHAPMPGEIGRQMAEAVAGFPDRPVEITLSPEELGRVRMVIATSDGTLTLQVVADRPDTLDLMRRHADQLAQDFRDMGFDKLEFRFGGQGGGSNREGDLPRPLRANDDEAIAPGALHRTLARPAPVGSAGRDLDIRI